MKERHNYDIAIIGAGPIGLACAIEAEKLNLSYLILEKGVLVNSIYHFPTNMTFFSTSRLLEIGEVPFVSHLDKPTRKEALEYYRRVADSWKLNIHLYEEVTEVSNEFDYFHLSTNKDEYYAHKIIVATGFYDTPNRMNIPGEDLPKVTHYYQDPHPYIGQKVAIIGAANSACDAALETYYKGAEVTMVIREEEISPSVKYWIRPNILNRIKEGSIQAHYQTVVESIHADHLMMRNAQGTHRLENDFVLAMTGYRPNYPFLQSLGISFLEDGYDTPTCDDHSYETNVPGIYLAGVICGGMKTNRLFIENSRFHAELILKDIHKKLA